VIVVRNKEKIMSTVFARLENGRIMILNERGQFSGRASVGSNYVSVQVNGEFIMATRADGRIEFLDKNACYTGRSA
jgi:hypothetical protein